MNIKTALWLKFRDERRRQREEIELEFVRSCMSVGCTLHQAVDALYLGKLKYWLIRVNVPLFFMELTFSQVNGLLTFLGAAAIIVANSMIFLYILVDVPYSYFRDRLGS